MSTNVASGNGLVIVTHVYREQDDSNRDAQPKVVAPPLPTLSGNCGRSAVPQQSGAVVQFIHLLEPVMKREQTTVGTVQVLIGVIVFLFGIVRAAEKTVLSAKSGVMFWGSIIHAVAGCLTVQAKKNPSQSLDKALLRMNILNSITAVVAIALYSSDIDRYYYWGNKTTSDGISGIMIVLSIAEFVISAAVSVSTYYAISSSAQEVVLNQEAQYLPPSYESVSSVVNTSETTVFPSVVPTSPYTSYDKPENLPSSA